MALLLDDVAADVIVHPETIDVMWRGDDVVLMGRVSAAMEGF